MYLLNVNIRSINSLNKKPEKQFKDTQPAFGDIGHIALGEIVSINAKNRYRLDKKPNQLISELFEITLQAKEEMGSESRICSIRLDLDSKFSDIARYLEANVFYDAWYKGMDYNTFAELMNDEYQSYDNDSKFIILMDTENIGINGLPALAGMARVTGGKTELLKTVHDVPEIWGIEVEEILENIKNCVNEQCNNTDIGNPEKTWDYSSLAVNHEYWGTDAYSILSGELYKWSQECGINTVTTILVEKFYNLYQLQGVPFRAIKGLEPREHMGEMSIPAYMHLPECPEMLKSERKSVINAFNKMANGEGLNYFTTQA